MFVCLVISSEELLNLLREFSILRISIYSNICQIQLFRGALRKRGSENMQQIYRRTPMPSCNFNKSAAISIKLLSNFIENALRHRCSPVNLLHIFRTPFTRNTSGQPLLSCFVFLKFRQIAVVRL